MSAFECYIYDQSAVHCSEHEGPMEDMLPIVMQPVQFQWEQSSVELEPSPGVSKNYSSETYLFKCSAEASFNGDECEDCGAHCNNQRCSYFYFMVVWCFGRDTDMFRGGITTKMPLCCSH